MSRLFFIPQAVRIDSTGTPYALAEANFYLTTTTTPTDTYTDNARSTPSSNPVIADAAGQFAAIYLDPAVTYRCIITEASAGAQIDDIDPVHAPIISSDISSVDAGGFYDGTDVEAQLQDIGNTYGKKTATGTWTADQTFAANLLMADNEIRRAQLTDYAITHSSLTQSSGTVDCDLTVANSFSFTLTENATITLSNPPADGIFGQVTIVITQDGSSGAFTVTWPAGVDWPGATPPVMSTGNDAVDKFALSTQDAGVVWLGDFSQSYA
jgi:hypothetical protein